MTGKTRGVGRGPGRPLVHDPAAIAELLAERELTGESFAALAARSGISAATLGRHAKRCCQEDGSRRAAFVRVVAREGDGDDRERPRPRGTFTVILGAGGLRREVVVPADFDVRELLRLVETLESRC